MILELLKIRAKQFFRIIKEIGFFRTIIVLSIFVFLVALLNSKIQLTESRIITLAVYFFLIFYINLKRPDKNFVRIAFSKYIIVFFIENFFLSLPLFVILITHRLWFYFLAYSVLILLLSFLKIEVRKKTINSVFLRMIPKNNFEWKSGMRKYFIFILVTWFLGVATSFYVVSVPLVILVIGVIIINFYEKAESLQILLSEELNSKKYIHRKIFNHLRDYLILNFPLIVLFLVFNIEYFYIPVIIVFLFSVLLIYSILLKYSFFRPNENSGATQFFVSFGIISIFIPIFIPVILILIIRFYFKAIDNLNIYLDDFN